MVRRPAYVMTVVAIDVRLRRRLDGVDEFLQSDGV
jgi:hypothetical protein